METIEKIDIKKMKEDIKEMAKLQKWYKNQRKTVHKNCERKPGDPDDIQPWVATMKHASNREKLRVMYAAYGQARGRKFSYTENKFSEEEHPLKEYQWKIDKILEGYKVEVSDENQTIGEEIG